jgi:hypothetical protein
MEVRPYGRRSNCSCQVISVVEQACCALRESGSNNPVKTIVEDPGHHPLSYSMVVFVCNSGMAVTDAALGRYIADLAPAAGRGERVDFW